MKKISLKTVTLLFAIILTLVLGASLFACNKGSGEDETVKRNNADAGFVDAVLSGVNPEWSADMSVETLAGRKDAGEYVLVSEWCKFFGDVLNASPVVTSSVNALSSFLTSETGKALLSAISAPSDDKIEVDFSQLISTFNEIGVTSSDLTEILYLTIFGLLDKYEAVFDRCSDRLSEIRDAPGISDEVKSAVSTALVNVGAAKGSFESFADAGERIKSLLNEAKTGLSAIVDFAFGISSTAFTGNLLDSLTGGALDNISENETVAYVSGIVRDVSKLKSALTDEQISSISEALKLLLDKTDALNVNSAGFGTLFLKISETLKYVYSAVDYIPLMCDLFKNASSAIDVSFVTGLKAAFAEGAPAANKGIYMAKLISAAFSEENKADIICALTEKIDEQTERSKIYVLMQADLALNALAFTYSNTVDNANPDISSSADILPLFMSNDDLIGIMSLMMIDSQIASFKDAYAAFKDDPTTSGYLSGKAQALIDYSGKDPLDEPSVVEFTGEWYNCILFDVEEKLAADYEKYGNIVKNDLKIMINEFLFDGYYFNDEPQMREPYVAYIRKFAEQTPAATDNTPEYEKLEQFYLRSKLSQIFDSQIH